MARRGLSKIAIRWHLRTLHNARKALDRFEASRLSVRAWLPSGTDENLHCHFLSAILTGPPTWLVFGRIASHYRQRECCVNVGNAVPSHDMIRPYEDQRHGVDIENLFRWDIDDFQSQTGSGRGPLEALRIRRLPPKSWQRPLEPE